MIEPPFGGSTTTAGRIEERADLLSGGLDRIGLAPDEEITVLVCDRHGEDRAVALEAIRHIGHRVMDLDPYASGGDLVDRLTAMRGGVMFACAEGVDAWKTTKVPMRVIGDGPGTLWWKAFELRQRTRSDGRCDLSLSRGGCAAPLTVHARAS